MMTRKNGTLDVLNRQLPRLILGIVCLCVFTLNHVIQVQAVSPAREWSRRKVIVLDPGHGGTDTGAVGASGLTEKAVTLSLAQKIKDRLAGTFDVYLTRDDDRAVDIERRTEFANHHHADLFVSIHTGGAFRQSGSGVVVFYQGLPSGIGSTLPQQGRNLWNEHEEPPSWTGLWTEHAVENRVLAEIIHQYLGGKDRSEDEGVRQAPVLVLEGADMPAVLVEVGCLTHPGDEAALGKSKGVSAVAESICRGIKQFFRRHP